MTFRIQFIAALAVFLAGCGGGDGGGGSSSSGSGGTGTTPSTTSNVQSVSVSPGVANVQNMLLVSVTVCVPNTTQCQTIDNVQVDTGSQGLRLLASAVQSLSLPVVASASGSVTGACAVFGTGYTWGAVRSADVKLAGEVASNVPIQVIGDPSTPDTPNDCAQAGGAMQTQGTLRANGILGIGPFQTDCGAGCASSALPSWYYTCTSSGSCTNSTQPIAQQVTNPVVAFAADNNGTAITLPSIPSTGSASVPGSLTFGIGTQLNNGLGAATVLTATTTSGYITSVINATSNPRTFIDSGSNGIFFSDSSLTQCNAWYCPVNIQTFGVTLSGASGSSTTTTSFQVANAQTLFATTNNAFNDLAGPLGNVVDLGLPFFFGRTIYTAIESQQTPAGPGPYYAF
ncbi:DUF3443 domain-containing protein [Burkholderia alba]|uniref:DUF3443 domain-containing protein n=1 Tax=Burkholderia alba TaxID=2683677 RepID=UPI002B0559EE|nr:DUF3443 domain-containing protein [Burkholderia alba]